MNTTTKIALFEEKKVRKVWFQDQWYFSVIDVIYILTGSKNPKDYLKKMRKRDMQLDLYMGTNCPPLEMQWETGKIRYTLCANTESTFRIIQSIPSLKAEPFKRWLAKVGYERMQEIENPELAQERMKELYEQKWYPKDRIVKRLRGIAIRQNLTDEWRERGIADKIDFAILTAEISKATFGMTPAEYKEYKWIDKKGQNLRDHMTDFELIFTMLGEKVTTEISQNEKPIGLSENKKVAWRGGQAAGKARQAIEKEIGKSIISNDNYLSNNAKLPPYQGKQLK